eukprot:TRINITY_DN17297_c1_g1_i1.p1 TRINITY_DN17297_c1_g1~~TRINITY_DN17297_c1_g1_i1.p1  ORF type:complete len:1064 (+),score=147.42 TRINITY_DN17297_c1_g1_i1:413-3193(+)
MTLGGLAIGNTISGFVADLYGRRVAIVMAHVLLVLSCIFMTMSEGFISMVILRLCHGIACGLGIPASMTMLSETVPTAWRTAVFILYWSCTFLGEVYASAGMLLFMPMLEEEGAWHKVVLWSAFPAMLVLCVSVGCLQESVHWLSVQGYVADARIVLEQMAHLNRAEAVLKKLGPRPSYCLSHIAKSNTINARCARDSRTDSDDSKSGPSMSIIFGMLGKADLLRNLLIFSVLVAVGSFVTLGLDGVWPALLRHESREVHVKSMSPALQLLLLGSLGFPAGIFCSLVSNSAKSHKAYIFLSGILGAVSCAAVVVSHRETVVLMLGIIGSRTGGLLCHSVVLLFLGESFSTSVRSSATGLVMLVGVMCTVATPFVLEHAGERSFLGMAAGAFLFGCIAAIPLSDTKGLELNDFSEGSNEEQTREEAEDAGGASSDSSDAEPEGGGFQQHALFFYNGTLGASFELPLLFGLLGAAPGMSFTHFYAGMGYYIDVCRDRSVFAKQMLVGFFGVALMALISPIFNAWMERKLKIVRSMFIRIIFAIVFLAFLDLLLPMPQMESAIMMLGFTQSVFNAVIMSAASGLAEKLRATTAKLCVSLGFVIGTALPAVTNPFILLTSHTDFKRCVVFYTIPAVICLVIAKIYLSFHRAVGKGLEGDAENLAGSIRDLMQAYRAVECKSNDEASPLEPQASALPNTWCRDAWALCLVMAFQVAVYFFAGLFPLLEASGDALSLYLCMVVADMAGSLLAFVSPHLGLDRLDSLLMFLLSVILIITTTAATLESITAIRNNSEAMPSEAVATGQTVHLMPHSSLTYLVLFCFLCGSFARGALGVHLSHVAHVRLLGALVGLLAVCVCYGTTLQGHLTPQTSLQAQQKLTEAGNLSNVTDVTNVNAFNFASSGSLLRTEGRKKFAMRGDMQLQVLPHGRVL